MRSFRPLNGAAGQLQELGRRLQADIRRRTACNAADGCLIDAHHGTDTSLRHTGLLKRFNDEAASANA